MIGNKDYFILSYILNRTNHAITTIITKYIAIYIYNDG